LFLVLPPNVSENQKGGVMLRHSKHVRWASLTMH
jgi:hypothetical protein